MTSALTIIDYLFIAVFALAFPLVGLINYRKLQRQMEQGVAVKAHQLYWHTIIGQWLLLAVGLVAWLFQGRSWSAMGFVTSMPAGFTAGLVLALLVIVGLCWQLRQIFQYTPEQKSTLAEQFHSLAALLPRSRNDLLTFYGLSVTAGIVEEIIWRGMLIWYLGHFVPLWLAGVAPSKASLGGILAPTKDRYLVPLRW